MTNTKPGKTKTMRLVKETLRRLDGELSPGSKVQDPFLRSAGRRAFMNERPAPVENRGTEDIGNIDCGETRRAECRHEEDEL